MDRFHGSALALVALFTLGVFILGVVLTSQSRAVWISAVLTIAVLSAVRWYAARVILTVALVIGLLSLTLNRTAAGLVSSYWSASVVGPPPVPGVPRPPWRTELWVRALHLIQDAPLTGIGLGAFRVVAPVRYPFFPPPLWDIVHAHNTFLQMAVDVGLAGLVGYAAMLILVSTMSWQIFARGSLPSQSFALGLWGNLLAVHIFGLTDAIALGAKVGIFFWWNLGLIGCLHMMTLRAVVADGVSETRERQ